MMTTIYNLTRSSSDPQKLSLTIKGLLIAILPILLMVASSAGVEIPYAEAMKVIDSFVRVVAAVMVLWGATRKIHYRLR